MNNDILYCEVKILCKLLPLVKKSLHLHLAIAIQDYSSGLKL